MFLEGKVTQIAIGQIRGYLKPSKAERAAAFELFVELSVRVTTPSIDDERGTLRDTFDNLGAIGDVTREILRKHGCDAAKGRKDGNITLAVVALRVLNEIIAPRVISWEPALRDHESQLAVQPSPVAPYAWEQGWEDRDLAIDDLADMRREIRSYMDTLALIAGTPSLTDLVVPLPPSAPITPAALAVPIPRGEDDAPRQRMVRWFSPFEALGTMRANRGHHPGAEGGRPPVHPIQTGEPIVIAPGADGCTWIDYVSDLGDGFDPTAAVAFQLTRESITLPIDRSGELPEPPGFLPRGTLLVMGGDEVYPHASDEGYRQQLVLPYTMAASAVTAGGAPPDPAHNTLVAIPGNHDWYGGHEHFDQVFARSDTFAGHWSTPQKERWWSVQLPHGWWMWGIDTALDNTMDDVQKAFFREAADRLQDGDQVILCTPVPLWQLRQKREEQYNELRSMFNTLILEHGGRTPLFLSGDSHFFAHYRRVDGVADEHHITAGGGGAFMQPTHNLPEQVPYERGTPEFKLDSRWPRPVESRALGTDLGNIKDPQFRSLFVIIALLHAAFAGLISIRAGALQHVQLPARSTGIAARWVIAAWPGWPILALLLISMMMATAPNSQESHLVKGAKRYGLLHGAAQAALFVAVAAFARSVGPHSWWWRFALVPLIGGVLSTVLFVLAVRWINRSIKANDTLAFSSAHLTRYKQFVRICIDAEGDLQVYVVGIDPVGAGWYDALTNVGAERALVPPFDPAGVSKLHYVWGHSFANGSERQILQRGRTLGQDHPDTLYAVASLGRRMLQEGDPDRAVDVLSAVVAAAERSHGPNHPTTLGYSDSLAAALLQAGDRETAIDRLERNAAGREQNDRIAVGQPTGLHPRLSTARAYAQLGRAVASTHGLPAPDSLVGIMSVEEGFRWSRAMEWFQRALVAYAAQPTPADPVEVATVRFELAEAFMRLHRDNEASDQLELCGPVLAEAIDETDPLWNRGLGLTAILQIRAVHRKVELNRPAWAAAAGVEPTWVDTAHELPLYSEDMLTVDEAIAELVEIHDSIAALPRTHEASIAVRLALADVQRANGFPKGAAQWLEAVRNDLAGLGDEARTQRIEVAEQLIADLRAADDWPGIANATACLIADLESGQDLEQHRGLHHRLDLAHAMVELCVIDNAVEEVTELLARLAAVQDPPSDLTDLAARARVDLTKWLVDCHRVEEAVTVSDHFDTATLAAAGRELEIRAAIVRAVALQSVGRLEQAKEVAIDAWRFHSFHDSAPDHHQAHLLSELAVIYDGLRDSETVVQLLEPRLALIEQAFGTTSFRYLGAAEVLAKHLANVGRAAEAVPLLEQCLETRQAEAHDASADWCETLLQTAAETTGDHQRALEIATRQLARHEIEYGPVSHDAMNDLRTIARLTQATDPRAAIATFELLLEREKRRAGPHTPAVLGARLDLARAFDLAGQPDRSLEMWERALPVVVEQQADNPTLHLRVRFSIARLSVGVGDARRAIALYEQIVAEDEATDLESYRVQLAAVTNLAIAYCDAGRAEDAVRAASRAITMAAARLPRTDPSRQESERFAEQIIAAGGQPTAPADAAPDE